MSELTALQNLTKDFVHTYLASQIAAVLRMANGYIYVRLDGVDPKTLEDKLKAVLGKEGDLKTQISRGGLEVVFAKK
jgi:hypothetical protein